MKILVISNNPFSNYFNNGKTLESLFSWVPKENLAQLFFHDSFIPDFDYCRNYFKVSDKEVLSNILNGRSCGKKVISDNSSDDEFVQHKRTIDLSSLQIFRDYLWMFGFRKTKRALLYKWILDFSPTHVFFVGGNCGFAHDIAIDIANLSKSELFSYFTDDYIIYPKYKNILKKIQKFRLKHIYRNTINNSLLCFVIGESMASEYSKFYNRSFLPIMNSVPMVEFPRKENCDDFIISYFGNLGLNRWKMIVRFAQLLNNVCLVNKQNVILQVYSTSLPNDHVKELFEKYNVQYMGLVLGDEYREALIKSNLLLHIESDDVYTQSLTRLSISTKLPEYMVTRRPIIAYGPKNVASILLLLNNNIGYVIDSEQSKLHSENQLNEILSIKRTEYDKLSKRAYDYVSNNFSLDKVVERFKNNFN